MTEDLFIATVGTYSSSLGGATLILPGQTEPTQKRYKHLSGSSMSAGYRVLVAKVSGTYVILGRIV